MKTVDLSVDARGAAILSLQRPEKRNAMSAEMIGDLTEAAAQISASDEIRVVVLAAEGQVFCAGGDLGWMRDQMSAEDDQRRREALKLAEMLRALDRLPVPLIGRVHGNAFGGGVGLMSVCDTVFASEGTKFGLTETKLGLIPATIGPYVLARIGAAHARRLFYSSRIFDVSEACDIGLVSKIVAPIDLDAAIEAEIAAYLSCAPGAVRDAKKLIEDLVEAPHQDRVDISIDALVRRWSSAEAAEGTSAFFEKRQPTWEP